MKICKRIVAVAVTMFFSFLLFSLLTVGIPEECIESGYRIKAGFLSFGICFLVYGCFCYIGFLQRQLEEEVKKNEHVCFLLWIKSFLITEEQIVLLKYK